MQSFFKVRKQGKLNNVHMYTLGERNLKNKHIKHHIQDNVCLWERDTVSCKDIGNILFLKL